MAFLRNVSRKPCDCRHRASFFWFPFPGADCLHCFDATVVELPCRQVVISCSCFLNALLTLSYLFYNLQNDDIQNQEDNILLFHFLLSSILYSTDNSLPRLHSHPADHSDKMFLLCTHFYTKCSRTYNCL